MRGAGGRSVREQPRRCLGPVAWAAGAMRRTDGPRSSPPQCSASAVLPCFCTATLPSVAALMALTHERARCSPPCFPLPPPHPPPNRSAFAPELSPKCSHTEAARARRAGLQRALAKVPSAVAEAGEPGVRTFGPGARAACLAVKFGEYSLAGMACGLVGQAIANAAMMARRARDPDATYTVDPPPLLRTALVWGLFMGVSSNIRYQAVFGLERLVDVTIARNVPQARTSARPPVSRLTARPPLGQRLLRMWSTRLARPSRAACMACSLWRRPC